MTEAPRRSVVMERAYVAIALLICESLFGACPPAPELLAPVPATRLNVRAGRPAWDRGALERSATQVRSRRSCRKWRA